MKTKRLFSLILTLALIFTSIAFPTQKAEAATVKTGTARYASEYDTSADYPATYYYKDDYFKESSYTQNHSLATMSMILSMAAGRSNETSDYSKKTKNLEKLWKNIGFSDFSFNKSFKSVPVSGCVDIGIAKKNITVNSDKYTLISLVISGTRLEEGNGSIFEIGDAGDASAYDRKKDETLSFLRTYLKNNHVSGKIKLWLTGYHMAGGVINLVSSALDDGVNLGSGISLDRNDMYSYAFNALKTTISSNYNNKKYQNIFSYNNPYLLTTHLFPEIFKFHAYGKITTFPSKNTSSDYASRKAKMMILLNKLDASAPYELDNFINKKISIFGDGMVADDTSVHYDMAQYLDVLMSQLLETCAPTRKAYVRDFETDYNYLYSLIIGLEDPNWIPCLERFASECQNDILGVGLGLVLGNESTVASKYKQHLTTAVNATGVKGLTNSDITKFANIFAKISCKFGRTYSNTAVTFLFNMEKIFLAADITTNLAWVETYDPMYNGDGFDLAFSDVTLSKTSYAYTGDPIKPSVKVKVGSTLLEKSYDYKVSYSNNTKVGKATITIKGLDNYAGSIKKTFKIVPPKVKMSSAKNVSGGIKVSWKKENTATGYYVYRKAPGSDSYTKIADIDSVSTLSYTDKDVTNGKKYVYAVKAYKGSYVGALSATKTCYYVKKPALTVEYKTIDGKRKAVFSWKSISSVSGYQLALCKDKSFPASTTQVESTSSKVTSLSYTRPGTTSYVRVRAFKTVDGEKYYSAWSTVKSFN